MILIHLSPCITTGVVLREVAVAIDLSAAAQEQPSVLGEPRSGDALLRVGSQVRFERALAFAENLENVIG